MKEGVAFEHVPLPDFSDNEILRYAGFGNSRCPSDSCGDLLSVAKSLSADVIGNHVGVVYRISDIIVSGDVCDFGFARVRSASLAKSFAGAHSALFMCTTLGVKFDALVMRYMRTSPALAHMISSVGSERTEAVCDSFCRIMREKYALAQDILTPRFSPGYGDLALDFQRDVFAFLQPQRYIGLTLNSSLIMSPSKSVSAIMGIKKGNRNEIS